MRCIELIKSDLIRLCGNSSFRLFMRWYFFPQSSTFPHDVWFRILQACKQHTLTKYTIGLYAYFRERHFSLKYGVHINSNINIGEGLLIVHGGVVYINASSIGSNFTCYQSVTLGKNKNGVPKVEDNVTVFPGVVIAGDIILHTGYMVGANSYVDKDVAKYTTVCGLPAKAIKKRLPNNIGEIIDE